jgi:competence protein ComEA
MKASTRSAGLLATLFLAFALPLAAKKEPPAHPVNLNTASLHDLMTLPGIGPTRAEAILEFRRKNGQFRSANDLLVIHGMSKKRVALLRPYITTSSTPTHTQPIKPKPKTTSTSSTKVSSSKANPNSPKATPPKRSMQPKPANNPASGHPDASQPANALPSPNPGS